MGKQKNKSESKGIKKFTSKNKVLLAAVGGAAAGFAITRLLATEKAGEMMHTVEGKVRQFGHKTSAKLQNHEPSQH